MIYEKSSLFLIYQRPGNSQFFFTNSLSPVISILLSWLYDESLASSSLSTQISHESSASSLANTTTAQSSTVCSGYLSFAFALVFASSSSSSSSSTIVPRITVASVPCQKNEAHQVSHRFLSLGRLFFDN